MQTATTPQAQSTPQAQVTTLELATKQEVQVWQGTAAKHIAAAPTKCTTAEEFEATQKWLNLQRKLEKELEAERMLITKHLDQLKKEIMAAEKEIASPLTEQAAAVKAMQDAYLAGIEAKRRQEQADAEAKLAKLRNTEQAALNVIAETRTKIAAWGTIEEATAALALLNSWQPKCKNADLDADAYVRLVTEGKRALVQYAEERLTAMRAGATTEIAAPVIEVSTAAEQMEAMATTPEVQLKNVRTVYEPVVTMPCDLVGIANAAIQAGVDIKPDLTKWLKKVQPNTPFRGVVWKESKVAINK